MTFEEIAEKISAAFPAEAIVNRENNIAQPAITLRKEYLGAVCQFLSQDKALYFDLLSCLTAVDNGPTANSIDILYHLCSIPFEHRLVLKVMLPRTKDETSNDSDFVKNEGIFLPSIPTVSHIWRTAIWHEREAFDLVGVWFQDHPDMRRILLPADWQGHPLRKDYQNMETYHGIKVVY
jgi:NADH-quinone oxidoreductase subunit C